MTRLQKKCLIAAAGAHLLVVVVVLCSGFIMPSPKVDETQLLTVIPSTAIDALLNSGVKSAPTPPPAPEVTPVEPTPPAPEPPQPIVTPPPQPRVEPPPADLTPVERPDMEIPKPKPVKQQIQPDLQPVVRDHKQVTDDAAKAQREAQKQARARARAIAKVLNNITKNASEATEVDMPGDSSASYANYGAIVVSVYHDAWVPPQNMTSDTAVVSFSVTIARDGSVISSHIVNPSGESNVDAAVRRLLERVNFIHEFPADTRDQERTYNIDFNATRTNIQ